MSLPPYASLSTEQVNPGSRSLDRLSPAQIVRLMNREDRHVIQAVSHSTPQIAKAVGIIVKSLGAGHRLFFIGAGTSGRLGIIEAAECPPTFNTPHQMIQGIMAGGKAAVFKSKEGSEDSEKDGATQIRLRVRPGDVVVGIAASGVTPFVRAGLQSAMQLKAHTVLVTCNPKSPRGLAQVVIALSTGPEILTGSTRLKAGSACKMVLNMLTTASMAHLGKVYGNRMVDLQPKSRKLVERGVALIRQLGEVDEKLARRLFEQSRGHVKVAIVMARKKISLAEATKQLRLSSGFLRQVI